MPEQLSAQSATLEENLSASLLASLRDDNRKNCEQVLETLEDLEGKLHSVKKALKRTGGSDGGSAGATPSLGGGGVVNLDTVLERVAGVAGRLEAVQAAVEANITEGAGVLEKSNNSSLSMALLLTEVRKRADSESLAILSQDMFKAVHNVQKRLLEEHVSAAGP
jgi:hypothetical protein